MPARSSATTAQKAGSTAIRRWKPRLAHRILRVAQTVTALMVRREPVHARRGAFVNLRRRGFAAGVAG